MEEEFTYLVQEVEEDHLGVTLTTVTSTRLLARLATLHDHDVWHDVSSNLIQAREDLAHVVLLGALAERDEAERLGIVVGIRTEDIEHDARCWPIVTGTDNHTVADNDKELALVIVLRLSEGVDRLLERSVTFRITRDLTDDELVVVFRRTRGTEVDRGDELETDDADHHDGECEQDVRREEALR